MMPETTGKYRVFFIADNPKAFSIVENDLINHSNLEIIHFSTIDVALNNIEESPPNLILTDGRVGDKTALQLLGTLQSDKKLKSIPVVIYTRAITNEIK